MGFDVEAIGVRGMDHQGEVGSSWISGWTIFLSTLQISHGRTDISANGYVDSQFERMASHVE
jgi:hypothetical protein